MGVCMHVCVCVCVCVCVHMYTIGLTVVISCVTAPPARYTGTVGVSLLCLQQEEDQEEAELVLQLAIRFVLFCSIVCIWPTHHLMEYQTSICLVVCMCVCVCVCVCAHACVCVLHVDVVYGVCV